MSSILKNNKKIIRSLREKIHKIEHGRSKYIQNDWDYKKSNINNSDTVMSLGNKDIDLALPWNGLPTNALHEFSGDTSALGFLIILLTRLIYTQQHKHYTAPILWCEREQNLYVQGLMQFGIDPNQITLVHCKNDRDILWSMEEGLRSSCLTAVVGCPYKISPIAARRLSLRAEEGQTMGILLHKNSNNRVKQPPTNSSLTRWLVTSAPSNVQPQGLGLPQWNLELQRCRLKGISTKKNMSTGNPQSWQMIYCNETNNLSVVTEFCDRPNKSQNFQKITS